MDKKVISCEFNIDTACVEAKLQISPERCDDFASGGVRISA